MNTRKIIEHILDGNPSGAKDELETALYYRVGESMREDVEFSVARNFREEKAASDSVILGEDCDCEIDDDCECPEEHDDDFINEVEKSPEQKAFKALFDKILKKYGVDSPNDLEDSKKDDFFDEVGREWKKDPANDDEGVGEEAECLPCQKKKKELDEHNYPKGDSEYVTAKKKCGFGPKGRACLDRWCAKPENAGKCPTKDSDGDSNTAPTKPTFSTTSSSQNTTFQRKIN
jgi:hypothetical protein